MVYWAPGRWAFGSVAWVAAGGECGPRAHTALLKRELVNRGQEGMALWAQVTFPRSGEIILPHKELKRPPLRGRWEARA